MHQMFVDMAFLVQTQGEMIDNIEVNIRAARDYVREGVKELSKAQVTHEKSRKVKWSKFVNFSGNMPLQVLSWA
jgi:t-SNARE complex subunit (syntaxin)